MTLENLIKKSKKFGLALGASLSLMLADNYNRNQIYAQSPQIEEENYSPIEQELKTFEIPLWRVLSGEGIVGGLGVSGNGKAIVFEYRQKEKSDIYWLEIGNENILNLTYEMGEGFYRDPDVDEEGFKITFSGRLKEQKNEEVYYVDLEKKLLFNISNNEASDFQPSISADAKKIAFTSERDKKSDIYLVSFENSEPKKIINFSDDKRSWNYYPCISGNGKEIVFAKEHDRQSVCLKNVESNEEKILEESGSKWYLNPQINYDGTRVVWSRSKSLSTTKKTIFLDDVLVGNKIKLSSWKNSERPSIDSDGRYVSWLENPKFGKDPKIIVADTKSGKIKEIEKYYLGELEGSELYLSREGIKSTNYFFKIAPNGHFIGIITSRDGKIVYNVQNPHLWKRTPLMKE